MFINAGTEIPFTSSPVQSSSRREGQVSTFRVYEANKPKPDLEDIDNDFIEIMSVEIDHGRSVPKGHPHESRMQVDKNGLLTIEARDTSVPDLPYEKATVQLRNLSKSEDK